jgi:hypothetical protein
VDQFAFDVDVDDAEEATFSLGADEMCAKTPSSIR